MHKQEGRSEIQAALDRARERVSWVFWCRKQYVPTLQRQFHFDRAGNFDTNMRAEGMLPHPYQYNCTGLALVPDSECSEAFLASLRRAKIVLVVQDKIYFETPGEAVIPWPFLVERGADWSEYAGRAGERITPACPLETAVLMRPMQSFSVSVELDSAVSGVATMFLHGELLRMVQ